MWSQFFYVERQLAAGFGLIYEWREPGNVSFLRGCIVDGDTFGNIVSIPIRSVALPTSTTLYQNYLNPFNPTTSIVYDVAQREFVRLAVFDILGREVRKLVEAIEEPGVHTVAFDGSGLASGIYVFRLQASGGAQTRRMILLR